MTEAPGRSILVVYTGGTIGMVSSGDGYVPQAGAIEAQLVDMPRFHVPGAPRLRLPPSRLGPGARYDIVEHDPPLDSSNMSVREWVRVAREIEQAYDRYDAFVVLHGTDTMAYTASALSFMLEDLGKPVVLTGSQIPLDHLRNDAIDNLLGALLLAAHEPIPEVTLYFRDTLYRGNRVQKVDASGFDAFDSGNWPPLAHWGITIEVDAAQTPVVVQIPVSSPGEFQRGVALRGLKMVGPEEHSLVPVDRPGRHRVISSSDTAVAM